MTNAHIEFYGPDYAGGTNPAQLLLVSLHTDSGGDPKDVLPHLSDALTSTEAALYETEGVVWNLLPSPQNVNPTSVWSFTTQNASTLAVDWSYIVTHDGSQDGYTVTVRSKVAAPGSTPSTIALNKAPDGLLTAYNALP